MSQKERRYEQLYQRLLGEVLEFRRGNQRRIRKGLWALVTVTVGLLALVFISQGSKVIFLLLWIVSMFAVAAYLIGIEYMDYQIQHKVSQIMQLEQEKVGKLLSLPASSPRSRLAAKLRREADTLEGIEPEPEKENLPVFDLPESESAEGLSLTGAEPVQTEVCQEEKTPSVQVQSVPESSSHEGHRVAQPQRGRRKARPSNSGAELPHSGDTGHAVEDSYSLEYILAEYGRNGTARAAEPEVQTQSAAPVQPDPAAEPIAAGASAGQGARPAQPVPLDMGQLMQQPQRMARVARDLSLLSQGLQGLSEDLWRTPGEEEQK